MIKKHKIGLALGSGGPKGLAHIGVIKALLENHIPINMIAGTSAGAVIGGLYCAMGDIEKVEEIFTTLTVKDLALIFSDISFKTGVIKGNNIEVFFDKYLKNVEIENLKIPFMALTTDIQTGLAVRITSGSLTKAMRASSSIPGLIDVLDYNSLHLVDGGVSEPVPVRDVRALGANYVIAVNLDLYNFVATQTQQAKLFAPTIGITAIKLLRYHLSQEKCREADIKIEPQVQDVNWGSLTTTKSRLEIIRSGYLATINQLGKIKF